MSTNWRTRANLTLIVPMSLYTRFEGQTRALRTVYLSDVSYVLVLE